MYPGEVMETVKIKPVIAMPICGYCRKAAPKCECGKPTPRPSV